jgi:hypothetical protein
LFNSCRKKCISSSGFFRKTFNSSGLYKKKSWNIFHYVALSPCRLFKTKADSTSQPREASLPEADLALEARPVHHRKEEGHRCSQEVVHGSQVHGGSLDGSHEASTSHGRELHLAIAGKMHGSV